MRFNTLLVTSMLLAGSPAIAQPFDVDVDASIYVDVDAAPAGSEIPDISYFFDLLAPYGSWVDDRVYGFVFVPADRSYTPYANGFWRFTDYGWTWISDDPFGWATDHYGRWLWRGRWVWKPDTTWGPAWVQWRTSGSVIGWAPLGYEYDAYIPETQWRFIPTAYIASRDVRRHYVRTNYRTYLRDTQPVVRWYRHGSDRWVAGPDRDYLNSRHRLDIPRDRVNLREVGRLDREERRVAELRTQQARTRWQDRVRRENEVRATIDRRRAETERRQVQHATEQRKRTEDRQRLEQRQRTEQQQQQQRQEDRQRLEQRQRSEQQQQQQQRRQEDRQRLEQQQRQRTEQQQQRQEERQRVEQQQRQRAEQQQRQRAEQQQQRQEDRQRVEQQQRQRVEQQQRQRVEQQQQRREDRQRVEQQRDQAAQQRQQAEQQRREQQRQRAEQQAPRSQPAPRAEPQPKDRAAPRRQQHQRPRKTADEQRGR